MVTLDEYAALIATDQQAFTEECFLQVSPADKYQHNWHIECLPYEAKITTPFGEKPIGWIVENKYDGYVLSFNHKTNKPEWKKVVQHFKNPGHPLDALLFSTGDVVELTGSHPVFINGRYVNAEDVKENDKAVCLVQERFPSKKFQNALLWTKMFCRKKIKKTFGCMLNLWRPKTKQNHISLPHMLHKLKTHKNNNAMRSLRERARSNTIKVCGNRKNIWSVLQQKLLWSFLSLQEKQGLHRRKQDVAIPIGFSFKKEACSQKRKLCLLSLWNKTKSFFRCSSYRQGHSQQRDMESCCSLSPMPQQTEGQDGGANFAFSECYVAKVTKSVRIPEAVYNIGVEDNNNYFTGNILVHNCIIEHLRAVEEGELKRLLIMMPPREMKSITITIAWTAWLLGHHPDWRIICASYGDALAKRQSIDTRLVVESDIYQRAFPSTHLAPDQNEKGMFMTTRRGFRKATSVGGQILGDGAEVLVFDDLLKADEAPSDTVRNNTNAWLDQSFLTRANNPATARFVGVAQRLHMDDPMGHLMERGGWHTLILPAEFKRKTIISVGGKSWEKEEGELFNPSRLTREILDQKLRDLGPTAYAGQYMQSPTPADGGMFKSHWIQHHDVTSWRGMNGYILCDPANTKKKNSGHDPDWSIFFVLALASDNNYYVADIVRDRLNPAERCDMLMKLHRKWNARFGKPPKVGIEQYGMMTDAFFIKQRQAQDNYRFPITELGGTIKKEDRVQLLVTPFSDGRVYLPKSIPYTTIAGERLDLVKELIAEYDTFPLGRHDDIMDAFARILDPKMNAIFPMVQDDTQIYRAGSRGDEFDANDFRSW